MLSHGPHNGPVSLTTLPSMLGRVPLGSKVSQPLPLNRGPPLFLATWKKVLHPTGFYLTSGWGSLYLDYCSPSSMTLCKLHGLMAAKEWQTICMWFAYHLMPHSYENKMYTSFLPITAMNAHLSPRQADQDPQTNYWLLSTKEYTAPTPVS